VIPVSIANDADALTFTASASFIAVAQSEVAAVRNKLVGASEAHTKVKTEKTTVKIAAWLFSRVWKRSR
jgi:hypothetical protein